MKDLRTHAVGGPETLTLDERLYGSSPDTILDVVAELDDELTTAVVVAHDPGMSDLAHRLSGEIDYLLKVVVPDINAYDGVYKRLIEKLEFSDVSSSFAMEDMKFTTALPLKYSE